MSDDQFEKTTELVTTVQTRTTVGMIDSRCPQAVEIDINRVTKTIRVNIDGVCRCRIKGYDLLILNNGEKDDGS